MKKCLCKSFGPNENMRPNGAKLGDQSPVFGLSSPALGPGKAVMSCLTHVNAGVNHGVNTYTNSTNCANSCSKVMESLYVWCEVAALVSRASLGVLCTAPA